MNSRSEQNSILYVAALLSIGAGFIHMLVVQEHFDEWWGYGTFFLATVVAQALFAPVVIRWPWRTVFIAGIVGNLAIAAMWAISRSIGVPFFGPGAGEVEPVGTLDVISTAAEIVLIVILAGHVWPSLRPKHLSRPEHDTSVAVGGSAKSY